ncbi:CopD family protein [Jongsikchunia kroppenstedtii]|uniref:CopD family protein n=1 Tax=Jongsikchunia kroppenstedtii TaxID=1121721 RepID=UPI00038251E0|nr:CopD family protein [Jongsikchunia kroppenstedtii]
MTAGSADPVARVRIWRVLIGSAVPAALLGVGLGWALAHPAGPQASAVTGGAAVAFGIAVFGLAWLPATTGASAAAIARPVAIGAMLWAIAAFLTSWIEVAERADRSLTAVSTTDFFTVSGNGLPSLVATGCAVLAALWAWSQLLGGARSIQIGPELAGAVTAVGVCVGPVTGHLGQHDFGSVAVAVHTLAAAWWCGSLAAIALVARGRRDWARLLPVFSRRAPWAVGALTVSGIIVAVMQLDSVGAIVDTGYGRVMVAKLVGLIALLGLAWRHRSRWVPRAADHRATEAESLRHAVLETLLMAVVLGLAAALATTAA